jgi:drug/metabolite transporter (DMT)-like permease
VGAILVWGLIPVAVRYFVAGLDPLTFSAIRFIAMAVCALPLAIYGALWRWPRQDVARLILCGILAVPGLNVPSALAARTISAGGLGLLAATEPIFIVLFSLMLTRAGVSLKVVAGGLIALTGVFIAFSDSAVAMIDTANLGGAAIGLLGAASWGLYTVLSAPLAGRYGSRGLTGGVLLLGGALGAVTLAPLAPSSGWPSATVFGEIALVALSSSLLGFLLWNYAAGLMKPAPLGLLLYLLPVIAILGGAAFLNERLPLRDVLGGAVILLGVSIGEGRLSSRRR